MREASGLTEITENVQAGGLVILEIGDEACMPCHAIRAKISQYLADKPDITGFYLSANEHPDAAAELGVLSAPTVIVYAGTKRMVQKSGYFSVEELFQDIERYRQLIGTDESQGSAG